MAISDLYCPGEHLRNLDHFASIVDIAAVGGINEREEALLKRFAGKLDITQEEFIRVLQNPSSFPMYPQNTIVGRLERLHDLFRIIYADNQVEGEEIRLLNKYAVKLGFSPDTAEEMIKRSVEIFIGQISFEDYLYLLNKGE